MVPLTISWALQVACCVTSCWVPSEFVHFAIKEGLVNIVKASITGSIIGNILFVFGGALFIGGLKNKEQKLNIRETSITSTMLLAAVVLLLLPSMLFLFNEEIYLKQISIAVAIGLIGLYLCSLIFLFYTHKNWFATSSHEKPKMKKIHAFFLMLFAVVVLLFVSEGFAHQLENIAHALGFGELFVGAVLVGVVGNAAEHFGALQFATKDKMSLVLSTTIGSSLQIAMFVAPILVFVSIALGHFMSLAFLPIEIVSILVSVFLLNEIAADGRVNWLEGIQLIILYLVIAVIFFFA